MLHIDGGSYAREAWHAWTLDPLVVSPLIAAAVLYWSGARRSAHTDSLREAAYWAGWVLLTIAFVSPLHALSEQLFSAHMIQHTIIMTIAAPLIVFGRPAVTGLWALRASTRRRITQHALVVPARKLAVLPPSIAFVGHAFAIWVWHLPVLYDAALQNDLVHSLQHACFFITAVLFWHAVLAPRARATGLGSGVIYVFATAVHTALLGALIALSPRPWYPYYNGRAVSLLSPLEDQQLAGMIMWVPAGLCYTIAGLALLAAWLKQAEARNTSRARPIVDQATEYGAQPIIG